MKRNNRWIFLLLCSRLLSGGAKYLRFQSTAPSRIDPSLNPSRVSRSAAARCNAAEDSRSPPSCVMFAFLIRRVSVCVRDYGRLGFKAADLVVTAVS